MSFMGNLAPQGVFDNRIKAVYTITLLGCTLDDDSKSYLHEVVLYDKVLRSQLSDNLAYYYLELPKFTKNEDDLETIQDKWMYAIKNLQDLKDKPSSLTETVFTSFFEIAKVDNFSEKEKAAYKSSLMKMWNRCATFESSYTEGFKLGKEEGAEQAKVEVAIKMKESGFDHEVIFKATGLKEE